MNNTTTQQQTQTRLQAVLTLAAQPTPSASDCPEDAQLAALIDDQLQGATRERLLQHLHTCPACYQLWQCSLDSLAFAPKPSAQAVKPAATAHYWQTLVAWWQTHHTLGWLGGGAVTALASTVFIFALLPNLTTEPNLKQQLDGVYQALRTEHQTAVQQALTEFTLPRPAAARSFTAQGKALPSQQAFTAGLQQGQQALRNHATTTPPDWADSPWSAYYALGRWTIALWTVSQFQYDLPAEYWTTQGQLLQQLQQQLADHSSTDSTTALLSRLQTIADLLAQLPAPEQPQLYEQFGRELNLLMQIVSVEM